ncbi:MAG: amidohydrolase family protein [Blastocatellia bacterium]
MKRIVATSLCAAFILALAVFAERLAPSLAQNNTFDMVIRGGRVMDPESGLDGLRDIGIRADRIAAISVTPLRGALVIDAQGQVVAPGFIDLHSHSVTEEGNRYQAMDGVTTSLELEIGTAKVAEWYAERAGKLRLNYGVTAGHVPTRMIVAGDTGEWLPRDKAMVMRTTPENKKQTLDLITRGLDEGAIGVGLGIAYVPASSREEIYDVFRLAAARRVTCFVHARSHGTVDPGSALESMQELVANAAGTGAALHIVHVNSTSLGMLPQCLDLIGGARQRGVDVSTESYPYTAGMTGLESGIFDEGWQEKLGVTYKDLQWAATGERLTAETFAKYRKQGGMVALHSMTEDNVRRAILSPFVIVASDGIINNGKGHPRAAGTFTRVLARYVRELRALPLMEAINKMSLMPARRLETAVPRMKNKGRIKIGADADLVVFDPARVSDRATFEDPAQYSVGISHTMVNGVLVVTEGKLVDGATPGMAIRRK